MKTRILLIVMVFCFCAFGLSKTKAEPYQANWESLRKHKVAPEWFRDAKFGIYFCWGVYSVPAFGTEWYPRTMHLKDKPEYRHHMKKYGDPSEFGYPDFVPMFKAEKFDPDEWADLFARAGARFAGPIAEHCDGFAMWETKLTPWNAKDMGPKRDIVGEMAKAIRKHNMKFITTFHHTWNHLWEDNPGRWGNYFIGVKRNFPSLLENPKRAIMYGDMPRDKFVKFWKDKIIEVIDKYQPDLVWFDNELDKIPEQARMECLAYYFNKADSWNKEVLVTFKFKDLPKDVAVEDYEKGRLDRLTEDPWLTDDTIAWGKSWSYTETLEIKSSRAVLHILIDIVSKNGQLLLCLAPKADGTIPNNQRQVLLDMGDWLKVNGEAIYSTRPWRVFGQGPTRMKKSGHFVGRLDYTAKDVRFTRSKDGKHLYAIVLGWPKKNELILDAVKVKGSCGKSKVTLLGYNGSVNYRIDDKSHLVITLPKLSETQRPCKFAYAFRISNFNW